MPTVGHVVIRFFYLDAILLPKERTSRQCHDVHVRWGVWFLPFRFVRQRHADGFLRTRNDLLARHCNERFLLPGKRIESEDRPSSVRNDDDDDDDDDEAVLFLTTDLL